MDFHPNKTAAGDRELLLLRRRVGGSAGELRVGSKAIPCLKLLGDVYVATQPVDKSTIEFARMKGIELRVVKGAADTHEFSRQYTGFKEAYGQEATP